MTMGQKTLRLVSLHVSPWSERARWALDHHRIAFEKIEHAPFLGERKLRKIVGAGKRRATVPVLITEERVLTESWDIALFADRVGEGTKLVPEGRVAEVRKWNSLADELMSSGRLLVIEGMLANPEALDEGLPREVPGWLRPLLRPVGRQGMRWFARKYGLRVEDRREHVAKVRAALEELRGGLAGGAQYLLGAFSYADIVMATCLQGVSPVADRFLRLGPATREAWTQREVAADVPDLIAWRDGLYERHRKPA
jgi:glutathione S-transferase